MVLVHVPAVDPMRHGTPSRIRLLRAKGGARVVAILVAVGSMTGLLGCGREIQQPPGSATDPAVSVAAGDGFTCAARRSGDAVCWGLSTVVIRGVPPLRAVSASGDVACGVGRDAKAYCWTLENLGSPNDLLTYRVVARGVGSGVTVISSNVSTCILMKGGTEVGCANAPLTTLLNVAATTDRGHLVGAFSAGFPPCIAHLEMPGVRCGRSLQFPDVTGARSISADRGVCIVDAAGTVRCTSPDRGIPAGLDRGVPTAQQVSVRDNVACAVTVAAEVWCWGKNIYGSLGDGSYDELGHESKAHRVKASLRFRSVSVGDDSHTCAVIEGGYVACWGNNSMGQLGMGDSDRRDGVVIATVVK